MPESSRGRCRPQTGSRPAVSDASSKCAVKSVACIVGPSDLNTVGVHLSSAVLRPDYRSQRSPRRRGGSRREEGHVTFDTTRPKGTACEAVTLLLCAYHPTNYRRFPMNSALPDLRPVEGLDADRDLAHGAKALGHPGRVTIVRLLRANDGWTCTQPRTAAIASTFIDGGA